MNGSDGMVSGDNETLQVRITFEEPQSGVTVINLTHTDVPEEDRCVVVYQITCRLLIYSYTYFGFSFLLLMVQIW